MTKASIVCAALSENGHIALEKARKNGWSPSFNKALYKFGITEAAKMCGRSNQNIRDLEDSGKFPAPQIELSTSQKRGKRVYTLHDINRMRRHFNTQPRKPLNKDPAVVMMANFKGGVTKSYTTVHAAQYLALKGYRVLVVDLDSQATATTLFGLFPGQDITQNDTLLPFFRRPVPGMNQQTKTHYVTELYSLIKQTYFPGISIIPANLALYNAEFETPILNAYARQNNIHFEFQNILHAGIFGNDEVKGIAQDFDIILLDCPPSLGVLSINAAYAANAMIVPLPPTMIDLASTTQFFDMLTDVFTVYPDRNLNFIRILVTKHRINDKETHNYKIAKSLQHIYGTNILNSTMVLSEAVEKSSTDIKTIYDVRYSDFKGDRKTLKRALEAANSVNAEIERLIIDSWRNE